VIDTLIAATRPREPAIAHHGLQGRIAAHTGRECVDWCGHLRATAFSLAGNMLAGAPCSTTPRGPMPPTQPALRAAADRGDAGGEAAGGDKRGKQSAALVIHGEEEWSDLDLRVDDHHRSAAELERLEQVSRERWVHFRPSCRRGRIRPGSPTAPSSMHASKRADGQA
jgi:uncharacterized Ntn-hydrolase superfamily protein